MPGLMHPNFRSPRPRIAQKRQMRERRTAQTPMVFSIVLAAVELYIIFGGF